MSQSDHLKDKKNFCILPWIHSRIGQDGNVYPCCQMSYFYPYGNLADGSFSKAWNSDAAKEMRLAMLADRPFSVCESCRKVEASGLNSTRQKMNLQFEKDFYLTELTQNDGSLPYENLRFLDIRFSNSCNFKCRTCNSENSTAWGGGY